MTLFLEEFSKQKGTLCFVFKILNQQYIQLYKPWIKEFDYNSLIKKHYRIKKLLVSF